MFLGALRISDEDVVHTIIDFLSYLKLKGKWKWGFAWKFPYEKRNSVVKWQLRFYSINRYNKSFYPVEIGALDSLPSSFTPEEISQP